uniref:Uncharacterized protein n=1 Tax=Arundo donax TaxID=35708 RepID=A0A0A9H090_ARUDO
MRIFIVSIVGVSCLLCITST